jgi:hypothetical protein
MAFQQFPQKGGIPSGNTAGRPSSPVIGDTYYNGQLELLEIYNGTTWVASSAPPATPQLISVTDTSTADAYTSTAGKLAAVFQAGSGGGTPTQYNAFTTVDGFSASSSSTTVTLTGLTPGTSYIVYGNAQNNFGTTTNTPNAAAVTPSTLPQVRTIGTATASTSVNEVTVTWTNGSNGGKNLSAITITPFLNGTTAQTSRTAATTSSTSYTFTEGQLTGGASYTFKVKATNANGTCADSTATNSATMPAFITIDYLVIAGGGAGGSNKSGGGGAGGFRSTVTATGGGGSLETALLLSKSTNYTVTVGGGGAGASGANGGNGSNSVFSTITSTGGGGGGHYDPPSIFNGNAGGSGGGGAGSDSSPGASTGGAGTANQGYAGGDGVFPNTSTAAAGGGGGAGAVGGNGNTSGPTGGAGGAGVASSITGTSVTRAGGGGGGTRGGTAGAGGSGGGGAGDTGNAPVAGTANTGGGGGGSGQSGVGGANGGAGVVILRYADTATITIGAGLTGTESAASGGYKRATITAGSGNVSWA